MKLIFSVIIPHLDAIGKEDEKVWKGAISKELKATTKDDAIKEAKQVIKNYKEEKALFWNGGDPSKEIKGFVKKRMDRFPTEIEVRETYIHKIVL